MTTIDGTANGFRTRLDATATAMLDTIAALAGDGSRCAALHRIVAEHHAGLMRATGRSAAELVRLAEIATSVDGGVPILGRPGVDAGQGVTRPPAPTTFHRPVPHAHLGGPCLFGDRCGR